MRSSVIASTGSYLPETQIHNEDFSQFPDTSKILISQKTGVFSRRCAGEDECTSDIGAAAAKKCLEKIGFPPKEVEGIILSTSSPDRVQPATATRVQHLLGASNAFAFDINSVCSGSIYGMTLADSLIRSGNYGNILFIASEVYSKILNKKDFSTYPFFGDGAGAVLFKANGSQPDDSQNLWKTGILHSSLKTDGSGCDTICVPGGGTMMPFEKMKTPASAFFKMKGKNVFEFAVSRGTEIIRSIAKETGISLDDVTCFICHQANVNIILKISEALNMPEEKFYINLFRYGNTASASVLIALDEVITRGIVTKGDLILTTAFGGGLSWGANLIRI